jgi:hypothetical protein
MLIGAHFPLSAWAEVLSAACFLRNITPCSSIAWCLTYELFWKRPAPSLSFLRAYGCRSYVLKLGLGVRKLDARGLKGRLIGYEADGQLYRVLLDDGKTVKVSKHVKFCEASVSQPAADGVSQVDTILDRVTANETASQPTDNVEGTMSTRKADKRNGSVAAEHPLSIVTQGSPGVSHPLCLDSGSAHALPVLQPTPHVSRTSEIEHECIPQVPCDDTSGEHSGALPEHPDQVQPEESDTLSAHMQEVTQPRYPQRSRRSPRAWWSVEAIRAPPSDQEADEEGVALLMSGAQSATPMTYAEAMRSPDADEWRKACDEELASLTQHQVWDMELPPPGTRVVRSKWVFKQKLNAMGLVERYKARLVAKGFTQRAGIDYDEVWAPVGKHATFRTLLAVAAARDFELHQMDVKTAFLHGELEEAIWMQPPEGYMLGSDGAVCRLRKSIYGLKQASRAWHSKLKCVFDQEGLKPSVADPGLFVKGDKDLGMVYVLVWVNDLFIVGPKALVDSVRAAVSKSFEAVDLGQSTWFLGMEITRDRAQKRITLSQASLVRSMLDKFGFSDCRSVCTPLDPGAALRKHGSPLEAKDCKAYAEMVGCLLYVAVCTRPDIQFAASALARYMSCPTNELMRHAVHVFDTCRALWILP